MKIMENKCLLKKFENMEKEIKSIGTLEYGSLL